MKGWLKALLSAVVLDIVRAELQKHGVCKPDSEPTK